MFKVIIVDDEYDIRQGMKHIINWEEQGFTIVGEAEDGEEALELFRKEKPSLIISDIKMPGMNGLELAQLIKEENPTTKLIILSGYNDFTYARDGIRCGINSYLLKPVDPEELCRELANVKEILQTELTAVYSERQKTEWMNDYFYRKLVCGGNLNNNTLLNEYWMSFHENQYFAVLLVEIDGYGELLIDQSESDICLKRFAVRNILDEIVGEAEIGRVFEESDNRFGILLMGDEAKLSKMSVTALTRNMVDCTEHYAGQMISIGVGDRITSVQEIPISYQKAIDALGKRFFNQKKRVFYGDEVNKSLNAWSLIWKAQGLLEAIQHLNQRELELQLSSLFQELNHKDAPMDTIKDVLVYTLVELGRLVIEAEGDWNQMYLDRFGETDWIVSVRTYLEAECRLKEICLDIIYYLDRKRSKPIQSNINEIVHYIDNHYWEELNLKRLSDVFYVSSAYLGQLFMKETGQYFNDYLNSIRIKEAKKLLFNDQLSIAEISEAVGYKNTNHLYIHFKKMTSLSPGDYRKKCNG